eukprot:6837684-Pyramimonas_sp.AAC.1
MTPPGAKGVEVSADHRKSPRALCIDLLIECPPASPVPLLYSAITGTACCTYKHVSSLCAHAIQNLPPTCH